MILPPGSIFICDNGHLALYAKRPIVTGAVMDPDDVIVPDGSRPQEGTQPICWKCGLYIGQALLFENWRQPGSFGQISYSCGNWLAQR